MDENYTQQDEEKLNQEAELVMRTLQRDAQALGELYGRYVDGVYGYFYRKVENVPDAEALTSETFTRAIEKLSRFTWQGKPFGAWLFGIASRVLLEWRREVTQQKKAMPLDDLENSGTLQTEDILEIIIKKEDRTVLWGLVAELAESEQNILVLRHVHGLSYAEISKVFGRSEVACKQLHYRTLSKLRDKARESHQWKPINPVSK